MNLILRKIGIAKEKQKPEKLNTVGRLTLTMSEEKNESVISAMVHIGRNIETKEIQKLFEERVIEEYPKFRSKMKRQRFYKLHNIDIRDHIQEIRMKNEENTKEKLITLITPLMNKAFDMEKPLWELYIIRNYKEGGTILYVRVHHCIADGVALGNVLASLCDEQNQLQQQQQQQQQVIFEGWKWVSMIILMGCIHTINLVRVLLKSCMTILGPADPMIPHIKTTQEQLSTHKIPLWTQNYALDRLKKIGRPYQATLNDVMLTVIAGAIDRVRKHHSEAKQLSQYDIRCINPTNIRTTTIKKGELNNCVSFLFPLLPLGIEHPIRRMHKVKQRMDESKHMDEMGWMGFFVNITDMIPARFMKTACNWLTSKTTVSISNVRGPPSLLTILGAPVKNTVAFLPAMHGIGYSFCIFSYNDTVRIGITMDASILKKPSLLIEAIDEEIQHLESYL